MKETKVLWQKAGTKTIISCMQTGEHFAIREWNRETDEVSLLAQTFSAAEAWVLYNQAVEARGHRALMEQDKARRPENPREGLVLQAGAGHITDLQHPFIRQLYDDWRDGNRMRHGEAPTEKERHEFDLMVLDFLWPDMPEEIRRTMQAKPPMSELFDRFWAAYPRKSNKKDAEKAFRAIKRIDATLPLILEDIEKRRKTAMWTEQNGQYVPYPATYLRGEQWKNEMPEEAKPAPAQGKPLASGYEPDTTDAYEEYSKTWLSNHMKRKEAPN